MDIASGLGSQNSIEYLVQQYMLFEQRPKDDLLAKQDELYDRKKALSDLDSKLSSLLTVSERFTDPITDYFASKAGSSSDSDLLEVSTTSTAQMGSHSIKVLQLAASDTRVSQQYNDTDTSFSTILTDQTFSIEVGHPTEADADNRISLDITVDAAVFAQDNASALLDIADAINSQMFTSVSDETIRGNEIIRASVVNEESGKSRLVLRGENSGYTYRMDFTDSADNLLQALEINAAVQSSGTTGGYITDVGTGDTDSALNSQFVMDGLTYFRDSNTVTDALTGVTLKFQDTFATAETVTVTANTEKVKEEVEGFITAYNEALDYLKVTTQIDQNNYSRGVLSDDVAYRGILFDLRNLSISTVSSVSNPDYSILHKIGIETDSDGKLSIGDAEKFTEALEADSNYVADLFNSTDGLATKMETYLENYVKTGGTITNSKKNVENELITISDRIIQVNDTLASREEQLRQQFTEIQEMMYQLTSQQSFLSSFGVGG